MSMQLSDNVIALFADLGVEAEKVTGSVDLVIDRFDQWSNDCRGSMGLASICGMLPAEEPQAA